MTTTPAVSPKRSPTTTRCSIYATTFFTGTFSAGVCATYDCVWAALNNPDSQTPRCEDFWRSNPHLIPEATGYVCTPPDGCVRWYAMTYDRCMLDGALWCHHTSGLWRVCARQSTAVQPSGVPCPPTADADWVNRGREMTAGFSSVSSDQIVLTPGVWEFTLCLRGNHHQGAHSLEYPDLFGSDNVGFEVHGPWRFDFPGPNGDTRYDGWSITPHHSDPGAGDCGDPPEEWWTYLFCVVSADDWDHHRVMVVTSTGQNPPFMTHLEPSNRRFQAGYWVLTATKTS